MRLPFLRPGLRVEFFARMNDDDGMKILHVWLWCAAVCWTAAWAVDGELTAPEDADPGTVYSLRQIEAVDAIQARWEADHDGDGQYWFRRGVRADRVAQSVEVLAESTGLTSEAPVEFILIGPTSGHDYEALAVSYARPSDIHRALEFIGMDPGAPFNPPGRRFFPKGERVWVSVTWTGPDGQAHQWPAEALIRDGRTGEALPQEGFVFVGSQWLTETGERVYAADSREPQSVLSVYNEAITVLDRPRRVAKGEVYGWLHAHPEREFEAGQLLRIRLEPEHRDDWRRVRDVTLSLAPGADHQPLALVLRDEQGEPLHEGRALVNVLAAFNRIVEREQTPFVQLELHADTPLREARDVSRLLKAFEDEETLHIEPPRPGELYYRAFIPEEEHRDRAQRPSQVLELRLAQADGEWRGTVVEVRDVRERREDDFKAEVREVPVASAGELAAVLAEIGHRLPVLLVFVSEIATYGQVMQWIGPVQETHPIIYLYLEADGAATE